MQRKIINSLPEYPTSKCYQPIRAVLGNLVERLQSMENEKAPKNKDMYLSTFKEMNWSLGKCTPYWPNQVEETIQHLRKQLDNFQSQIINLQSQKKGSFFICGGGGKEKATNLDPIYQRIICYEKTFFVINAYQDKKLKEELVYNVVDILGKNDFKESQNLLKQSSNRYSLKQQQMKSDMNQYCELLKSVSVCPNGYIAKKLLKQLANVEWIGGILYEDGKIVDKNMKKAIDFYQRGSKKKQPQAIYRLGLLNQRGEYGKSNQYLKMWQEAAQMGHLQSMTDLGYLYQNGLQDEETGRLLLEPNPQKSLTYYKKAIEQNFPRALNNLASFYYNNENYRDDKKCLEFFQRAAEAQYVKSLYNLGIIYYQGDLGVQDEGKYKKLIKRAAEKGDVQGKQQYIEIMLNQAENRSCSEDQFAEMNMYCRQIIAEDEDNPYAYYYLGVMYESGYGVAEQPKTALLYYSKAARYPCPQAYIKMGNCYRHGFGLQQSSKDAIKYYKSAAESLPEAHIYIGQMYEKGYPDLDQNFQLAFTHYYNACNQHIPEGFTHLGYMYQHGRHVKKDEKKAEQYLAKGRNLIKKPTNKLSASSQLIQSSYYRKK